MVIIFNENEGKRVLAIIFACTHHFINYDINWSPKPQPYLAAHDNYTHIFRYMNFRGVPLRTEASPNINFNMSDFRSFSLGSSLAIKICPLLRNFAPPCHPAIRARLSSHYSRLTFQGPTNSHPVYSMNTYPICDSPLYGSARRSFAPPNRS